MQQTRIPIRRQTFHLNLQPELKSPVIQSIPLFSPLKHINIFSVYFLFLLSRRAGAGVQSAPQSVTRGNLFNVNLFVMSITSLSPLHSYIFYAAAITMDTLGSPTEKAAEMKTKSPVPPLSPVATTVLSETMETDISPDLSMSHDLSSLATTNPEEPEASPKPLTVETETKICGCIPIDTTHEELKRREMDIRQEQESIQRLLSNGVNERKLLVEELNSLNSTVQSQKKDVAARQESISVESRSTATLLEEVNRLRENRTQLNVQRKNSQTARLRTEFKLRELQLELCRKQLEEPDIRMDTTKPLYVSIQEDEKQVNELTEDIVNKTAVHKILEEKCQKTEEDFIKKDEEYQVLSKSLEEARNICATLQQDVDTVEEKIITITKRLIVLVDERKEKKLRTLEMDEELVYIEMCEKLKRVHEKKLLILASEEQEEEMSVDNSTNHPSSPTPAQAQKIPAVVAETPVSVPTTTLERAASVIVNSPLISPVPSSFATAEESTVPNVLPKALGSVTAEVEETEPDPEQLQEDNSESESSPQTQPMCLRMTPVAASSPPPAAATPPLTDTPTGHQTPSSATATIAEPPAVSNSPPITVVDSLSRSEVPQASPSRSLTPAAFAQSPDQISLSALEIALPFYAQLNASFPNSSAKPAQANDEKILYQDIVIGVRKFNTWFASHQFAFSSLDSNAIQLSAMKMKDYFLPFYRLLLAKSNSGAVVSVASVLDAIVFQAQNSNWYGMPPVEPSFMRQLLESNLRIAIDHGTKQKKNVVPSRVEFCPSSGAQSLPTFTIHPPATANETYRSSAVSNPSPSPARIAVERTTPERPQPVVVSTPDSSPMVALNSMISSHARQVQNQPLVASLSGEPVSGTNGYLVSDAQMGMARQGGWNASAMTNGMGPYHPQPLQQAVQNTAVVAPMQYTATRHRMPNVPQNVQPMNPWHPQVPATTGAQQYMASNMMQSSSRMQPYPGINQFYRPQPQQHAHFIPPNYPQGDPALQQQQLQQQQQQQIQHHQHQMAGFVAENSSRQMSRVSVQMQSPSPSQRSKQHVGTPQLPATLQHPQPTHAAAQQQSPQQPIQPVAHPNLHISQQQQQQRHMPQPSPPIANVQQRHFASPQLEGTRQASARRHSQEQPQQQVQVQAPVQGQTPPYICSKCGEEAHQKCSGCQNAFYCSRDCQVFLFQN